MKDLTTWTDTEDIHDRFNNLNWLQRIFMTDLTTWTDTEDIHDRFNNLNWHRGYSW